MVLDQPAGINFHDAQEIIKISLRHAYFHIHDDSGPGPAESIVR